MAYVNRLEELRTTLQTLTYYAQGRSIEIIIVDDNSSPLQSPVSLAAQFSALRIKVLTINNKIHINPCHAYNLGLKAATGDIIILQNPEVAHIDDLLGYAEANCKHNDYISFECYGLDKSSSVELATSAKSKEAFFKYVAQMKSLVYMENSVSGNSIFSVQHNGWLNHRRFLCTGYHYAAAVRRSTLVQCGFFDPDFRKGLCHDDDELVRRFIKMGVNVRVARQLCIHQFHEPSTRYPEKSILWRTNQKVFQNKMTKYGMDDTFKHMTSRGVAGFSLDEYLNKKEDMDLGIPKILHLYWGGNEFSILNYLTIKTFKFYNPDWEIRIYKPEVANSNIPWVSTEQTFKYSKESWFDKACELATTVRTINFDVLGFDNAAHDVYKSDFLRYYFLYHDGGVWSDFDILYTQPLNRSILKGSKTNSNGKLDVGIYFFDGVFPIGLLLASKNTQFFRECLINVKANYDTKNYQSIGASMWAKLFGNEANVLQKYPNLYILAEKTVYYYKWNGISEFFSGNEAYDTLTKDTSIVGVHWFNGSPHGKKYAMKGLTFTEQTTIDRILKRFMIQRNKRYFIDCKEFTFLPFLKFCVKQPFPKEMNIHQMAEMSTSSIGFDTGGVATKHDAVYSCDIMKDLNGIYLRKSVDYPLVSIVMSYYNRLEQLKTTLETISRSSYKNIEVIIVNDGSDDDIMPLRDDYDFTIKIKNLDKEEKHYTNSCYPYNHGFELVEGDITIIQNPEVCHVGDVIHYVVNNLTPVSYLTFSCFSSPSFSSNEVIAKNIANPTLLSQLKGMRTPSQDPDWYNHPTENPTYYHFCSAIHTSNLMKVRGMSLEYMNGYCFDDNDLVLKIKSVLNLNLIIVPPTNVWTIHQYHEKSASWNIETADELNVIKQMWKMNRKLYLDKEERYKRLATLKKAKIPKVLHLYWDGSNMSYLNYMTVISFHYYNPDWTIRVYQPTTRTESLSWKSGEHKFPYTGKNYYEKVKELPYVTLMTIDFEKIGFTNSASEVIKSDFLRYHLLATVGGVWSDFDILYINSIDRTLLKFDVDFDTFLFHVTQPQSGAQYYPIGFLASAPGNPFFKYLVDNSRKYYNPDQYQSIGADMIIKLFPTRDDIFRTFPSSTIVFGDPALYLPYKWNEVDKIFVNKDLTPIHEAVLGIHWFNGSELAKAYCNDTINKMKNKSTISYFLEKLNTFLIQDQLYKPIQYMQ